MRPPAFCGGPLRIALASTAGAARRRAALIL